MSTLSPQPVPRVVGQGDRFLIIADGAHRAHRPEGLLSHELESVVRVPEHGRRVIEPRTFRDLAPEQQLCATIDGIPDDAVHLISGFPAYQRADVLIEAQAPGDADQATQQLVGHGLVRVHPLYAHAHLPPRLKVP